jgi:hypothetical protein
LTTPKLAGLQHLGCIAGKGQCYGSPNYGLFEAKHLATVGCQSTEMLQQNYGGRRLHMQKVIAVGGSYSD